MQNIRLFNVCEARRNEDHHWAAFNTYATNKKKITTPKARIEILLSELIVKWYSVGEEECIAETWYSYN